MWNEKKNFAGVCLKNRKGDPYVTKKMSAFGVLPVFLHSEEPLFTKHYRTEQHCVFGDNALAPCYEKWMA